MDTKKEVFYSGYYSLFFPLFILLLRSVYLHFPNVKHITL